MRNDLSGDWLIAIRPGDEHALLEATSYDEDAYNCVLAQGELGAVGADEGNIKRQTRNLAIASGRGLNAGTSNTLAIELTYGSDAQPDIKAHMNHIEAWLRYYDKYNGSDSKRVLMEAAWCKALAKIDN